MLTAEEMERIVRDAALGTPSVGLSVDGEAFRRAIERDLAAIAEKGYLIDIPADLPLGDRPGQRDSSGRTPPGGTPEERT